MAEEEKKLKKKVNSTTWLGYIKKIFSVERELFKINEKDCTCQTFVSKQQLKI